MAETFLAKRSRNPNDGVRDTPDVSLFACRRLVESLLCVLLVGYGAWRSCLRLRSSAWSGAGGTSFASPIMAGIQALINQKAGGPQGNPASVYYQLAAAEYGSSGQQLLQLG